MPPPIDLASLQPHYQFGYVLPTQVGEFIHYNFYQICPSSCLIVCPPMNLQSFSRQGVEEAIAGFWPAYEFLLQRKVDRITQGGIPITARLGRKRTLEILEEARHRSSIAVSADIEESISALKALGAQRIAIAAKWEPSLMQDVAAYLAAAGLNIIGMTGEPHTAKEVVVLSPEAGNEIAFALGRRAFAEHPTADALLLAGGAWQNLVAVIELEREFGRPIVTNPTASYWGWLKQVGLPPTRRGFGRLLDSLHPA